MLQIAEKVLLWLNVITAALYLLSSYIGAVSPESCGYLALFGLAYPLFLLFLLAFLPVWLLFRRRYLTVGAAALLLTLPQLWAFFPLNPGAGEDSRQDFRLMTYNTHGMAAGDSTMLSTVGEILKYDADFVCLQEVPPTANLEYRYRKGEWDGVKSRYPYAETGEKGIGLGFFSKSPVQTVCLGSDRRYFNYAVYRTEIGGRETFVLNAHLESIGLTDSDKELYMNLTSPDEGGRTLRGVRSQLMSKLKRAFTERAAQARILREKLDSLQRTAPDAYFFVCGDFNDTPRSYAYLTVRGDYNDAFCDGAFGPAFTYNANRFYFRIDHILYKGDMEAVSTFRGTGRVSDHYPLVSDFKVYK